MDCKLHSILNKFVRKPKSGLFQEVSWLAFRPVLPVDLLAPLFRLRSGGDGSYSQIAS